MSRDNIKHSNLQYTSSVLTLKSLHFTHAVCLGRAFSYDSRSKLQNNETAWRELISDTKTSELKNLGKFLYKRKSIWEHKIETFV